MADADLTYRAAAVETDVLSSLYKVEVAALVLGDGFLEMLELLAAGTDRQEALTRSYNNMISNGALYGGLNAAVIPPDGYRHGTACINGLADNLYGNVRLAVDDRLPALQPHEVVEVSGRLLYSLLWQVEGMRNHVVYGMPLGVAAQFGVDVATGRRDRASRKGHTKTALPLPHVMREVRWARAEIASARLRWLQAAVERAVEPVLDAS